jgi:hypothetical protein
MIFEDARFGGSNGIGFPTLIPVRQNLQTFNANGWWQLRV